MQLPLNLRNCCGVFVNLDKRRNSRQCRDALECEFAYSLITVSGALCSLGERTTYKSPFRATEQERAKAGILYLVSAHAVICRQSVHYSRRYQCGICIVPARLA